MNSKRVVITRPMNAQLLDFETKPLKDNDVLVENQFSLISAGTERAGLVGLPNTPGGFPFTPGYSSVGTIIETGKSVKELKEGDKVFVLYGGHAKHSVKDAKFIFKLDIPTVAIHAMASDIPHGSHSPELLKYVFIKLASYSLLGMRRCGLEIGENCVISGLGLLGQFGVYFAKVAGAYPVIAIASQETSLNKAKDFGADYVFSYRQANYEQEIIDLTHKTNLIKGAAVTIETSGEIKALHSALIYAAKQGRISLTGCNRVVNEPLDLYNTIHRKGLFLIGGHEQSRQIFSTKNNFTWRRDYTFIFHHLKSGQLDVSSLISEIHSPEDTTIVYERLANEKDFPLGVVFDWTKC
ncbi:alcohol dehydrogenase [Clostridia bacterium]|nr:alcohol dehydrogenase [Clostridia bacterium]